VSNAATTAAQQVVAEIRSAGGEAVNSDSVAEASGARNIVEAALGNFGQAKYSAAKLGIVALSESIALDMRRFNVRYLRRPQQ
jgi:NAD(P)-dependent dehydrogenase (short-subunit alcohol dehydrogenase family)